MTDYYKKKYLKYKFKYLTQKEYNKNYHGGDGKRIILNDVGYIDSLKVNDAVIYQDDNKLYVMDLPINSIMWRAYNNLTCARLHVPPGSNMDEYKYSPAWYGPPEAVIVYCAMNINDELMKRSYASYNEYKNMIQYNVDEYVKRNDHILKYNISSIIAYSTINPCKLIDINNIANIKKLLIDFRRNFTRDNYDRFNGLNRISQRQLNVIGKWSHALFNNNISVDSSAKRILGTYGVGKLIKENDLFSLMGVIIEWAFRYSIGYGDYMHMDNNIMVARTTRGTSQKSIEIEKYFIENYDNPFSGVYNKIKNIEDLRNTRFKDILDMNINEKIIKDKQEQAFEYFTQINDKARQYVGNKIKNYIANENNKIHEKKNNFENAFSSQQENSQKIINDINNGIRRGYVIELLHGSQIGFLEIDANKNYEVYPLFIFKEKKIENSFVSQNTKNCTFCELNKTRNWFDSKTYDKLSHMYGLANNFMYYGYHPGSDQVEPLSMAFSQIFGKNMQSPNEEKLLAVPFNHVATMGDHPDCAIGSKTFPPNGSYFAKNGYNCGVYLYQDNLDDETVFNFINTYNAAHAYAYAKTGKIHKDADLNYTINNGKYYKFKNPVNKDNNDPRIYLLFHTKANSIQHLHLHTYMDTRGSGLYDFFDSTRYNIEGVPLDDTADPFNVDLQIGGRYAQEIFGSEDYSKYTDQKEQTNKKYIKFTGNRLIDENTPSDQIKWVQSRGWLDVFGFNSQNYDKKYKYDFSGSFEYVFKRLIGIQDNDERMTHHYIFPQPLYYLQENIYNQQKEIDYSSKYNNYLEKLYNDNKYPLANDNAYMTMENKKNNGIKDSKYSNYDRGIIKVKYNNKNDETCITRQSITDVDTVMTLLLQFACIDSPEIGGYYGHIGPVMNKWKNITHTEICLFNLVDYPVKAIIDADYSSCNITPNAVISEDKTLKYVTFVMYVMYFVQQQERNIRIDNRFTTKNLFKQFLGSDVQVGGRANDSSNTINLPEVDEYQIPSRTKELLQNPDINPKYMDNNQKENEIELSLPVIKNIIQKYNSITNQYKISENDDFAHKLVWVTLYPFISTGGVLSEMSFYKEKTLLSIPDNIETITC